MRHYLSSNSQMTKGSGHWLTLETAAALIPMASANNLRSWLARNKALFPPKYTCIEKPGNCVARHRTRRVLTEDEILVIRGLVILNDHAARPGAHGVARNAPIRLKTLFEVA